MKKVAIIIQKLYGGGAERTASNLAVYLSDRYEVHLIVFNGEGIAYPYAGTLHDIHLPASKGRLKQFLTLWKRVRAVRKIKKENGVDASISLMDGANLVNVLSNVNDKVITSVRIQMSKSRFHSIPQKWFNIVLMRFIAHQSDSVVALSQGVRDDLLCQFGISKEKTVTIYNPCDGALLKEKALIHAQDAASMPQLSITTMGRFTKQKGQWHLLRAFAEVVKEIPNARLYILGDGPLKEDLQALTDVLHLTDRVVFLGYVEAPHAYISNSQIFVLPSLFEGLGNVLLEAMACGVPVISTDCCCGPREIIAPGTQVKEHIPQVEHAEYGLLTSVDGYEHFNAKDELSVSERQLAEAICLLLSDRKMRRHYQEKAVERSAAFTPGVIMKEWEALL